MTIQNDTELTKMEAERLVGEALSINPESSGVYPRLITPYTTAGYEIYVTEPGLFIVQEKEN